MTNNSPLYDVLIVGGGAAGLSAAQMLGRTRRSVAVIDGGQPRNAPAHAVHGFLSRDGVSPAELLRVGREEAERYGGAIVPGQVVSATGSLAAGFSVTLDDGRQLRGRRLLIATGLVDELPEIPGLRDRWGKDVLHCPFCHGWEVQDQAIGVLGNGPWSIHQSLLFRQWSSKITLFLNDRVTPTETELEQLAARGIRVIAGPVTGITVDRDAVTGVLVGGVAEGRSQHQGEQEPAASDLGPESAVPVQAVVVGARVHARLAAFEDLGLTAVEHPMGMGDYLATDADGATDVPGIWAAGNVTNLSAQVMASAAAAAWTAVVINNSLMADEMEADLRDYRERSSAALTGA